MNILKIFSVALIASLLILANVENRADELDSYLDDAIHMQVFEELKENMQRVPRLYSDELIIPANSGGNKDRQVTSPDFQVTDRSNAGLNTLRFDVVN